jgi:hypothetical protein
MDAGNYWGNLSNMQCEGSAVTERAKQSAYLRGGAVSLRGTPAAIVLSDHQLNSTNPPNLTHFNQSNSTKLQPLPFNINLPTNHFISFNFHHNGLHGHCFKHGLNI